jgi:hypothetical protein
MKRYKDNDHTRVWWYQVKDEIIERVKQSSTDEFNPIFKDFVSKRFWKEVAWQFYTPWYFYKRPMTNQERLDHLNTLTTQDLMYMLGVTRKTGGWYYINYDSDGDGYSDNLIKEVLATREHIPNKNERRKIRQQKARKNRGQRKSRGMRR